MIFTIAAKELRSLFGSPLAWVILAVLDFLATLFSFLPQIQSFSDKQPQFSQLINPPGVTEFIVAPLFGSFVIILMVFTPIMSMRLLAEERRQHTLPLLLSAPLSMTEIVLGKFIGLLIFLCVVVGLAVLMALTLYAGGILDIGLLATNILGTILLAASFAALGLYISSLTNHPVIAAIGTLGALISLGAVGLANNDPDNTLTQLSFIKHFEPFNKGLIDSGDLAYFALFIALFLILAVRRLDQDRLRG